MNLCLANRLALITGAGSGIGRETALRMATAGAKIAMLDKNLQLVQETAQQVNDKAGGKVAAPLNVDITELDQVEYGIHMVQKQFEEPLSIAVNCAGITGTYLKAILRSADHSIADGFLVNQTESQWNRVIDVNLKGTFFVTQAVAKNIIRNDLKSASIINISSIVGKNGNLGQANYAASKGGVISFSKTAAAELAKYNIRVNCILPGFIETPMAEAVPEKVRNKFLGEIPLKRFGTPKEVADVCVFLASESASYITGAAIEVTGGFKL